MPSVASWEAAIDLPAAAMHGAEEATENVPHHHPQAAHHEEEREGGETGLLQIGKMTSSSEHVHMHRTDNY